MFIYRHHNVHIYRRYNVHEVLALLEDEGHFDRIDVHIDPADDGEESAEDSGPEDAQDLDHLSGRQLRAQAVATIYTQNDRRTVSVHYILIKN